MKREDGYYWIRLEGRAQRIVEWYDGLWWFTGSEVPKPDEGVTVLAGPLRREVIDGE